MKKLTRIIILIILLAIILGTTFYFLTKKMHICGTPFTIRNSTGGCELKVGCELPEGMVEDITCREVIFPNRTNNS